MNQLYLVIEFDSRLVYIPFKNIQTVDNYTTMYDNLLELAATINKILDIGIPNTEIQDVYLSDGIDKICDDGQAYDHRYLEVMYQNNIFNKKEVEENLANFVRFNINKASEFVGLDKVISHYKNKYRANTFLLDKDIDKIIKAYLKTDYKRYKECYYKLKDKGYKFGVKEDHIDYSKTTIEKILQEDREMIVLFTNMGIDELKEYVKNQNRGIVR